jgi:type I restriction enzyme S subunit
VRFLDEKTARIDALIEKKRTLLVRLAEKRQALITEAVTKGLNPRVSTRSSGIDWLGDIPIHWEVRGLTKCTSRVDYRGATPTKSESGVFLITARNIKNGRIDYDASQEFIPEEDYEYVMRRGKPKIGEVLFTTEAPLGEIARIDRENVALAQRVIKFSTVIDKLTNDYLFYWMSSLVFQRDVLSRATGSTALGIKASKIVELRCLLPPTAEQMEISKLLDADARKRNEIMQKARTSIETLEEYRAAIVTSAITGQIAKAL